jgi:predicted ATP-binding protein involved in virulence
MISRIEVFKYRCFKHLDISLSQYNVLIGVNGTGKSIFLDIPSLLGRILSYGLDPAFLKALFITENPRVESLQNLIYCHQGDNFGFAIEAHLPQNIVNNLQKDKSHNFLVENKSFPQQIRN